MTAPELFDQLSAGLAEGVRQTDALNGLVLLGSASAAGAHRRDDWSDHDFFAIAAPGRGDEARASLAWLPDSDRIVLTAREGGIGFVAVYDDGHVMEFALAEAHELAEAVVGHASVMVDADGLTAELVAAGQARTVERDAFDPANDVRLVLVKLLLGIGRVRRGEVLNGGQFIRIWAVNHLVRAIRGRFPRSVDTVRDPIDPTRRFEREYPDEAAQIAAALEQPAEHAARRLYELTREVLEPRWEEFPRRAADAIARRLGW